MTAENPSFQKKKEIGEYYIPGSSLAASSSNRLSQTTWNMWNPLIRCGIIKQSAHGKNFIWVHSESLICCMRRKEIRFSNQRGTLRFKVDEFRNAVQG